MILKKLFTTITILFICANSLVSQEKLSIDEKKSTIKWEGYYTFYFGGHDGFINFKSGHFIKENEVITGGVFVIDMNSMTNTDIEEQVGKDNLIDHLKNSDFFEVDKYPLAKLEITKVDYETKTTARIEANMTIKESTKPINFRAEFFYDKKEMKTKFKIDRKLWGINYQSKFKDGAISDAIGFVVSIKL